MSDKTNDPGYLPGSTTGPPPQYAPVGPTDPQWRHPSDSFGQLPAPPEPRRHQLLTPEECYAESPEAHRHMMGTCNICDAELAWCTVCHRGEADLAEECPGPPAPPSVPPSGDGMHGVRMLSDEQRAKGYKDAAFYVSHEPGSENVDGRLARLARLLYEKETQLAKSRATVTAQAAEIAIAKRRLLDIRIAAFKLGVEWAEKRLKPNTLDLTLHVAALCAAKDTFTDTEKPNAS